MTARPEYFSSVERRASERWDQLELDRDLAGPWHQLFKQVQQPRQVLSELLQNADDAGATEASVRISDGAFLFEHNGEDFTRDQFESLCRFGYSNKRALHTIGFRGVGFKSTFSLGERVELYTPTLSVAFESRRFTQPVWIEGGQRTDGTTSVRVAIRDDHRKAELEKNLEEWRKSPWSLLFFNKLTRLNIGDETVAWHRMGAGPTTHSEWLMQNDDGEPLLLVRSEPEPFPSDALAEIRQERMITLDEEPDFPPCSIEIVLGAAGRLFVVLPTGVKTGLPFACNAPFVQDPARLKIKDPEISPTNRWLLERAGTLAASTMLDWLHRLDVPEEQRVRGYETLPDVVESQAPLEETCEEIVRAAFAKRIESEQVLLTTDGLVVPAKECVIVPDELLHVWPADEVLGLIDESGKAVLSRYVEECAQRPASKVGPDRGGFKTGRAPGTAPEVDAMSRVLGRAAEAMDVYCSGH